MRTEDVGRRSWDEADTKSTGDILATSCAISETREVLELHNLRLQGAVEYEITHEVQT